MRFSFRTFLFVFGSILLVIFWFRQESQMPRLNRLAPSGSSIVSVNSGSSRATDQRAKPNQQPLAETAQAKVQLAGEVARAEGVGFTLSEEALNVRHQELQRLSECAAELNCGFSQETPSAYHQELSAAIAAELRDLGGSRFSPLEQQILAREFMRFPDDFVKEEALAILARSTPSQASVRAILHGLKQSVSTPLYSKALVVLREQMNSLEDPQLSVEVERFVFDQLMRGGHFVSIEIARQAYPFLTLDNVALFEHLRDQSPPRSRVREYLDLNVREFRRFHQTF